MVNSASEGSARYPSFGKWIVATILTIPVGGFTVFWCLFHLGFGVPFKMMAAPFVLVSAITLLLAPSLYWAR